MMAQAFARHNTCTGVATAPGAARQAGLQDCRLSAMTLVCEVAISCASDEWIVGSRGNFMSIILSHKVAFSAPTRDHHLMHALSSKTSPVMCRHREGPDTLVAFAAFIECWVSTTTRWASVRRRDLERNTGALGMAQHGGPASDCASAGVAEGPIR